MKVARQVPGDALAADNHFIAPKTRGRKVGGASLFTPPRSLRPPRLGITFSIPLPCLPLLLRPCKPAFFHSTLCQPFPTFQSDFLFACLPLQPSSLSPLQFHLLPDFTQLPLPPPPSPSLAFSRLPHLLTAVMCDNLIRPGMINAPVDRWRQGGRERRAGGREGGRS